MLKIEKTNVTGWEAAIRGMRNPYNSWAKTDSAFGSWYEWDCGGGRGKFLVPEFIGQKDLELMQKLVENGDCHAKFARMLVVTADITAPRYWWPEFDTYKVGTVANSCSTMHTIMNKEFEINDFSCEGLDAWGMVSLKMAIENLNSAREMYMYAEKIDKKIFWNEVIKLLPQSFNQKRTIQVSYQPLRNMYLQRKGHRLDEWRQFREWIESLPHPELIVE